MWKTICFYGDNAHERLVKLLNKNQLKPSQVSIHTASSAKGGMSTDVCIFYYTKKKKQKIGV